MHRKYHQNLHYNLETKGKRNSFPIFPGQYLIGSIFWTIWIEEGYPMGGATGVARGAAALLSFSKQKTKSISSLFSHFFFPFSLYLSFSFLSFLLFSFPLPPLSFISPLSPFPFIFRLPSRVCVFRRRG